MKAIIFGANGQDGFYLAELLRRREVETVKISRSGVNIIGDVADWKFVENVIGQKKPEYIFHLAANSTTRHEAVFENQQAISTGTINILEAVYRHSLQSRVFLSGSALQFENIGEPIDEQTKFAPLSPYAVSRIHSVYAARYYRTLGLKICVGYFFNHDSPRRSEQHVNQKIAAAAKTSKRIEIGDISVKKEFNFAGDTVEAVWKLVNQDEVSEAVIGSGRAHSIEEWLELCFAIAGKNWRDFVTIKKDFKPEYRVLVSNPALISSLGWQPTIDINGLAKMMMEK
jgi:GDPmannose 4,6-dehydratase